MYLYSIIPFAALIAIDGILIYVVVFSMKKSNGESGSKKKFNMCRTIFILNISFILLTLPSAIISGYFYLSLSQSDVGYLALIFCNNLTFSFHSFNIITLFIFNRKFRSKLSIFFLRILNSLRVNKVESENSLKNTIITRNI